MVNKKEVTTNEIMDYLMRMDQKIDSLDKKFEVKFEQLDKKFESKFDQLDKKFEAKFDQLDKKFEAKFDMLFDAIGDINEKFTVMDYKFLQLKRQIHAT